MAKAPAKASGDKQAERPEGGYDLRITARREGFRRGGIAHPVAPTPRRSSEFSAEDLELIRAEPMLLVEELETDPGGAAP